MTTCRGCGKFFTEDHDEIKCELVAQALDDRRKFVEKEFEYLKEIERLEIELKKRDEQNAALAATVGALREAWVAVKRNDWDTPLNEAFEKTPQHHLRQVRADGVIDAANEHEKKYGNSHFGRHMREYADSILAGKE